MIESGLGRGGEGNGPREKQGDNREAPRRHAGTHRDRDGERLRMEGRDGKGEEEAGRRMTGGWVVWREGVNAQGSCSPFIHSLKA